ncbi:MAG: ribonuclease Z [Candidatus Diapherotrites archaeon]|nr:ribonuclease Z [Candidatus Diapherotrites archaeon]
MIRIVFLGTSCSNPTVERNLSATAVQFDGKWFLFDCPEGTQRQMMQSGVSYMKLQAIFFSHFHADHFLGFPGLVATMSMHGRDAPLYVFGPKGTKEEVRKSLNLAMMRKDFEIIAREVRSGKIYEEEKMLVNAFPLKHEVPCIGFAFKEKDKAGEFQRKKALDLKIPEGPLWSRLQKGQSVKVNGKTFRPEDVMDYSKGKTGKKISVVMDTLPNESYFDAIMDSDLLVHESAFTDAHKQRAKETKHSTAFQAAEVAAKTNAKQLVLTHLSPRNKDNEKIENEARRAFGNVVVAKDLMKMEL